MRVKKTTFLMIDLTTNFKIHQSYTIFYHIVNLIRYLSILIISLSNVFITIICIIIHVCLALFSFQYRQILTSSLKPQSFKPLLFYMDSTNSYTVTVYNFLPIQDPIDFFCCVLFFYFIFYLYTFVY
jgi:hypothetical protein